jgi:hypothetical protein
MSYWLYQHLGNLSPAELGKNELWPQMQEAGDAAAVLSDFAVRADQRTEGIQWSFRRSFGRVRVVVIDSRGGRVVEDGKRLMVNEAEWQWVTESVSGDWDHVVLATSLPLLLPHGIHALEAWNEAVCGGAWGKRFARTGERVRCATDLEHWAAFGKSFADSSGCWPGSRPGRTASRQPRSPLSRVTSTTVTWQLWTSRPGQIRAVPSTRRSARRPTICCRTRSGAGTSWPHHLRAN